MTSVCAKTAYQGKKAARREAKQLKDRYGAVLKPYRCTIPGCRSWHLGPPLEKEVR